MFVNECLRHVQRKIRLRCEDNLCWKTVKKDASESVHCASRRGTAFQCGSGLRLRHGVASATYIFYSTKPPTSIYNKNLSASEPPTNRVGVLRCFLRPYYTAANAAARPKGRDCSPDFVGVQFRSWKASFLASLPFDDTLSSPTHHVYVISATRSCHFSKTDSPLHGIETLDAKMALQIAPSPLFPRSFLRVLIPSLFLHLPAITTKLC